MLNTIIYKSLSDYVASLTKETDVEVFSFSEEIGTFDYTDDPRIITEIYYRSADKKSATYTYYGSFSDLLESLNFNA